LGTARLKLREILDSARLRGTDQVPLSNIKRLFRSLYQMELSETALGRSKLTELLQDPRFNDICTVQLQDRGYAVVPVYPDQTTPLNDNGAALGMNIPQVTPRSDTEEQERLNAGNGTAQQEHDSNGQSLVRKKVVPPLDRSPSPPRMLARSFTMPNQFDVGKEASDEPVTVLSHRSLADSKCSTARDLHGKKTDSGEFGDRRGLSRMDSSMSEGSSLLSPQRGAGGELRVLLQRRLNKAEGRV